MYQDIRILMDVPVVVDLDNLQPVVVDPVELAGDLPGHLPCCIVPDQPSCYLTINERTHYQGSERVLPKSLKSV